MLLLDIMRYARNRNGGGDVSGAVEVAMEQIGRPKQALEGDIRSILLEGEERYSSLQLFFLQRLGRLLQLRQQQASQLNREGLRLLDRAIFSTYCDCVDLGVGGEAQRFVQRLALSGQKRPEN
ncbi:MAG: hypothetical protein ACE5IZ_05315 [Dehalococcoidia bacterium]